MNILESLLLDNGIMGSNVNKFGVPPGSPTLCGALRSLWTPASWLMRGMSSLKVYSGGRVGSGKLVQLNGLVSSKN